MTEKQRDASQWIGPPPEDPKHKAGLIDSDDCYLPLSNEGHKSKDSKLVLKEINDSHAILRWLTKATLNPLDWQLFQFFAVINQLIETIGVILDLAIGNKEKDFIPSDWSGFWWAALCDVIAFTVIFLSTLGYKLITWCRPDCTQDLNLVQRLTPSEKTFLNTKAAFKSIQRISTFVKFVNSCIVQIAVSKYSDTSHFDSPSPWPTVIILSFAAMFSWLAHRWPDSKFARYYNVLIAAAFFSGNTVAHFIGEVGILPPPPDYDPDRYSRDCVFIGAGLAVSARLGLDYRNRHQLNPANHWISDHIYKIQVALSFLEVLIFSTAQQGDSEINYSVTITTACFVGIYIMEYIARKAAAFFLNRFEEEAKEPARARSKVKSTASTYGLSSSSAMFLHESQGKTLQQVGGSHVGDPLVQALIGSGEECDELEGAAGNGSSYRQS